MTGTDDSWKDSYDDWKLASPYDEYDEDEDQCDHTDAEVDILDWEFRCTCGHHWPASADQVNAEIEHQAAYLEYMEREERRQWWRQRLWPFFVLKWKIIDGWLWLTRGRYDHGTDDDIPF
jgi:hypothetical protein